MLQKPQADRTGFLNWKNNFQVFQDKCNVLER